MAKVGTISFWQWIPLPWRRWRVVTRVTAGDEIPEHLPRRGMAVAGSASIPSWIAFDCPCPNDHRLMLNLSHARRPYWQVSNLDKGVSLNPSVDAWTDGRRCHFWLKNGKIKWVNDLAVKEQSHE
jgi:hypothetical protein